MREFTITTAQLPEAMRNEIKRNLKATISAARETAKQAEAIVVNDSPVDQGFFKEAWTVHNVSHGAELRNDSPHGAIVEEGSRPHMPPREPIRQWLIRNIHKIGTSRISRGLDAPLSDSSGNPREVTRNNDGVIDPKDASVINRITYLICRKISKEGTKPYHILKGRQILFLKLLETNIRIRLNK